MAACQSLDDFTDIHRAKQEILGASKFIIDVKIGSFKLKCKPQSSGTASFSRYCMHKKGVSTHPIRNDSLSLSKFRGPVSQTLTVDYTF